MKRLLAACVLLIIVLAAVAPYVVGMRVQSLFQQEVERLAAQTHRDITLVRYERGWLHARAVTRVTLADGRTLHIRHRITHGPYAVFGWARIQSRVQTGAHARPLHGTGQQAPLRATTTIAFDGSLHMRMHAPAFQITRHDHVTVDWGGAQADIRFDDDTLTYHVHLPRLGLAGADGRLSLRDVTLQGKATRPPADDSSSTRWRTRMHGRIQRLILKHPQGRSYARASMQWRLHTRLNGDNTYAANVRATLGDARFQLPAQLSNRPLKIKRAVGHVEIDGIARRPLLQLLDALATRPAPGTSAAPTVIDLLRQYVPRLLSRHVTLSLAIAEFDSNFGPLGLQGKATIESAQNTSGSSPRRLLRRTRASVQAFIDTGLLRRTAGLGATTLARFLVQRHLLVFHNGRFQLRAHFDRDGLTLNGRHVRGLLNPLERHR